MRLSSAAFRHLTPAYIKIDPLEVKHGDAMVALLILECKDIILDLGKQTTGDKILQFLIYYKCTDFGVIPETPCLDIKLPLFSILDYILKHKSLIRMTAYEKFVNGGYYVESLHHIETADSDNVNTSIIGQCIATVFAYIERFHIDLISATIIQKIYMLSCRKEEEAIEQAKRYLPACMAYEKRMYLLKVLLIYKHLFKHDTYDEAGRKKLCNAVVRVITCKKKYPSWFNRKLLDILCSIDLSYVDDDVVKEIRTKEF